MFLVVLYDFANDEVQKVLGKFGVEVGLQRHVLKSLDLLAFAQRIGGREGVFSFQLTHGLCVFKALGQSVDQNGIQTVNRPAVLGQKVSGAGGRISQWAFLSA
jgi:hypothetical protein